MAKYLCSYPPAEHLTEDSSYLKRTCSERLAFTVQEEPSYKSFKLSRCGETQVTMPAAFLVDFYLS